MTRTNEPGPAVLRSLRGLVWLYFALLLTEGILRKWILPELSWPLYLVRDPVVVAIYVLALRARIFPDTALVRAIAGLAALFGVAGLFAAIRGPVEGLPQNQFIVIAYGLRANFLHLPLIFVLPRILRSEDVIRIGRVTLLAAVPLAVLMVLQFQSPMVHWLNYGAGGTTGQMTAAMGHVRPSGFFAFNTELRQFLPIVFAFFLYGVLRRGSYSFPLTLVAGVALSMAIAVSGNRGVIGGVLVVMTTLILALILRVNLVSRLPRLAVIAVILGVGLTAFTFATEGLETLESRIESGGVRSTTVRMEMGGEPTLAEHFESGVVVRFFNWFTQPVEIVSEENVPLLGYGLGMGSPAGAKLLGYPGEQLLAEDEWARIVMESGPLLGFLFILLRCAIAVYIGLRAVRACMRGEPLALLLMGAIGVWLLVGLLDRAPNAGLIVWGAGLALAAADMSTEQKSTNEDR